MKQSKSTLTLIELVVTILVLVALSSALVPLFGDAAEKSRSRVSEVSLYKIRDVIMGTAEKPGYLQDVGSLPSDLGDLFVAPSGVPTYDPVSKIGWRGPYLESFNAGRYEVDNIYGQAGDFFPRSGFSNPIDGSPYPIVLQIPTGLIPEQNLRNARLVSPGPNGVIDCPLGEVEPQDLSKAERVDDEVLFLRVFDVNGGTDE